MTGFFHHILFEPTSLWEQARFELAIAGAAFALWVIISLFGSEGDE